MNLILLPKFSPTNNVRVWIGAFGITTSPHLEWEMKSTGDSGYLSNTPNTIKAIKSIRPDDMLEGNPRRAFSGIYEFEGCSSDTHYMVTVNDGKNTSELRVKTLPVEISPDKNFNIMLVSCYHYATDYPGSMATLLTRLQPQHIPDLTFLMGDQVYLDLPTFKDFPDDEKWLAKKFEEDYIRNWRGYGSQSDYSKLLSRAPSISVPDDHEFWNNYPHESIIIGNSRTPDGRSRWTKASIINYDAFQCHDSNKKNQRINIGELSFFIADMRTNRKSNKSSLFSNAEFIELSNWTDYVIQNKKFGFFVSGQSLFRNHGDSISDYELPDYNDYKKIINKLKEISDNDGTIYCLTGDVHWGRVGTLSRLEKSVPDFIELITSPSSKVTSPEDPLKKGWNFFKKIIGKDSPWPVHSGGEKIEDVNIEELSIYKKETNHLQEGNQVAILSFIRSGSGINFFITYYPLHRELDVFNDYKKNIPLPKLLKI